MRDAWPMLIAVDGSEHALAAARCWSTWQGADPPHPVLLSVVPPAPYPWAGAGEDLVRIERDALALGEQRLRPARDAVAAAQRPCEVAVRIGAPADVIVNEATHRRVALIALGTRGLTPLRGLLAGSVALRVAQTSPLPLWFSPPGAACPPTLGRRLRLLVAVDGSDSACAAARWAADAPAHFGDVHAELLCVQPAFSPFEGLMDAAAGRFDHWGERIGRDAIEAARAAMGDGPARVEGTVRTGEAAETVIARAEEIGADAIVVGPRGLGAVGQTLLGSVTSALLQVSHRPVVVVPSGAA